MASRGRSLLKGLGILSVSILVFFVAVFFFAYLTGGEIHLLYRSTMLVSPLHDLVPRPNVPQCHPLVLVQKEDDDVGCVDELSDLVLPEVPVDPRLLVQSMRFVDYEHRDLTPVGGYEAP